MNWRETLRILQYLHRDAQRSFRSSYGRYVLDQRGGDRRIIGRSQDVAVTWRAQIQNRFLQGRQIACLIYGYFRIAGAHEAVLDYTDPFSISLHVDDIQDFDTRRDQTQIVFYK